MPRLLPSRSFNKRRVAYFLLLVNTICWGASLIFVKPAFETTTPFRFLLYRYLVAIIVSLPILLFYLRKYRLTLKKIVVISVLELLGTTLTLSLLYMGLARTSAVEASIITTMSPIFMVIGGVLFLKERHQRHEALGTTIAFVAATGLVVLPLFKGESLLQLSVMGNLLVLAQNITSTLFYLLAKKYYVGIPKLLVTALSFYIGLITFFILSLGQVGFSLSALMSAISFDLQDPQVWFASLYMAIFGSIIGLTAYIKGQELIEASEASLFWYLQPLFYLPLALILLREPITVTHLILLGCILGGVFLAEKRKRT